MEGKVYYFRGNVNDRKLRVRQTLLVVGARKLRVPVR